jgi:hypothetical protein
MKRCPTCQRTYTDETLKFCRDDGMPLQSYSISPAEDQTRRLGGTPGSNDLELVAKLTFQIAMCDDGASQKH